MLNANFDPNQVAAQVKDNELVQFKLKMDGLKKRLTTGGQSEQAQLKTACGKFEAIFVSKLWKQMRDTIPKNDMFHSQMEEQYTSMFDKDYSEYLADAGGIGLADMLYDQLSQKLQSASKDTLSGNNATMQVEPLPGKDQAPIPLNSGNTRLDDPGPAPFAYEQVDDTQARPQGESKTTSDAGSVMSKVDELARRIEQEHNLRPATNYALNRRKNTYKQADSWQTPKSGKEIAYK